VSVTNNCGQLVACPAKCPNGGTCLGGTCCTPTACGANCYDNCGGYNISCCDAGTPPQDAAPPPVDAGHDGGPPCGPNAPCAGSCCPGFLCNYSAMCVPNCGPSGGPCTQNTDCCYGLTCKGGAVATTLSITVQSITPADAGVVGTGTCQ
jgi:hypothetical protein